MITTATKIYLARALRDFGDGFVALLLPVYLAARGFDAFEIGAVATLALLGSALTTLGIGMIGARYAERTLLIAASALMAATGIAFAASSPTAFVFLIAFIGTINPSAGSVSIFVPLEHALIAHATPGKERTRTFARYSLIGALAAAAGAFAAATPEAIAHLGLAPMEALQAMFALYAVLGLAGGAIYAAIPRGAHAMERAAAKPLGPSRAIVLKLAALFAVDAFAGSFVVQSLVALWLFDKFGLSLTTAATFFLVTGLLAAASLPVAGWLGARIGLINTMVWTHIPANLALIAAALAPTLETALALLAIRALLSQRSHAETRHARRLGRRLGQEALDAHPRSPERRRLDVRRLPRRPRRSDRNLRRDDGRSRQQRLPHHKPLASVPQTHPRRTARHRSPRPRPIEANDRRRSRVPHRNRNAGRKSNRTTNRHAVPGSRSKCPLTARAIRQAVL